MKKIIFFLSMLVMTVGFVACSDDDDENSPVPPVDDPVEEPIDYSEDLTLGYGTFILNYDTLDKVRIYLSEPVEISNTSAIISYVQDKDAEGAYYLRPEFNNSGPMQRINMDEVTLTSLENPQKTKTITVYIHRFTMRAETDKIRLRMKEVLGHGIDPLQEIGTTKKEVLDMDAVLSANALEIMTTAKSTYAYRNEGTDYNKTVRSRQHHAGLSLTIPIKTFCIKPSVSITNTTVDVTENIYEYMTGTLGTLCAEGTIDENTLIAVSDNINGFRAFMKPTLNSILNNPGSALYSKYPNTADGLAKILDEYGMNFYTSAILGGNANVTWTKKQDFTSHSLSRVVNACVTLSQTNPTEITKKRTAAGADTLTKIVNGYTMSQSVEYGYSKQDEDIIQHSELFSSVKLTGGNSNEVSDFNLWKATDNPENWVPIAYATKSELDAMQLYGTENPSIHSILELCDSASSPERYKALKQFITPDENGIIPYYDHSNRYEKSKEGHWIISDAILITRIEGDSKSAPVLTFECPHDRVTRLYYPLVTNPNVNDLQTYRVGRSIDVNDDCYTGSSQRKESLMTIYYAMEWEDYSKPSGHGVTRLSIEGSDNPGKDIYIRGTYTDGDVSGDPKGGKHFLTVYYANNDTKPENKITAMGVYNTEWDGDNGSKRGLVFASSAGTEWMADQGWETQSNKDFFNSYWAPSNKKWTRGESNSWFNSIVDINKKGRPRTAHVCYTTQPITKDLSGISETDYGKPQATVMEKKSPINIPLDSGEK